MKKPRFKFMAMSKLIGFIAIVFIFTITAYSMKEMHDTGIYDALPQLIISAFGFGGIYAGFYLTMAKVEHVEEEKTRREKELAMLKTQEVSEEEIIEKKAEIERLSQKANDLLSETTETTL